MEKTITLSTNYGDIDVTSLSFEGQEGLIIKKDLTVDSTFIRIHSSCLFSEALHSNDCDCALQLNASLKHIAEHGGVIIYLYQEGRGIGLLSKIQAISLQKELNIDTASAFKKLGHEKDPRTYYAAIQALKRLGIKKAVIATSNPEKIKAIEAAGIEVTGTIVLPIEKNEKIEEYLREKTKALGHHEVS